MVMRNPIPYKYQEPVTGALGAGAGLVVAEIPAEYTARITGVSGYYKAAVKTGVKIVVGGILLGLSGRFSSKWSLFARAAAWAGMGSSVLDWILAYYPGGVTGFAGSLAMTSRVYSTGARTVSSTMRQVSRVSTPAVSAAGAAGSKY